MGDTASGYEGSPRRSSERGGPRAAAAATRLSWRGGGGMASFASACCSAGARSSTRCRSPRRLDPPGPRPRALRRPADRRSTTTGAGTSRRPRLPPEAPVERETRCAACRRCPAMRALVSAETGASRSRRAARRRVPDRARARRRGRLAAGPARAGRRALRGLGRAGLGAADGQGGLEAPVARRPDCRSCPGSWCAPPELARDAAGRRASARCARSACRLREAGQPGLVRRHQPRRGCRRELAARAARGGALRHQDPRRARDPAREIEVALLGNDPVEASVPARSARAASSTTTRPSTSTRTRSCWFPPRSREAERASACAISPSRPCRRSRATGSARRLPGRPRHPASSS